MEKLLSVSLRMQRVWVPEGAVVNQLPTLSNQTLILAGELKRIGFGLSESLLHVMNNTTPAFQRQVLIKLREVMGLKKGWTPLVRGWDIPTGETLSDHVQTFLASLFRIKSGITLQCGHVIPHNTFPIERYNGCPYCKTPFQTAELKLFAQGSQLKVLDQWTREDARAYLVDLLQSRTALDATQVDSLKTLLDEFPDPGIKPGIKETMMLVIDAFVEKGKPEMVKSFFQSPADIMRYLWYKKTGLLQIVEPRTLVKRAGKAGMHMSKSKDRKLIAEQEEKEKLKLKYQRKECLMVANWLNGLELPAEKICEQMHAKRSMWVRFIRALRLAEYSKLKGFENLHEVLDLFYNKVYTVWSGELQTARLKFDQARAFELLKQRPGLFARSLFANMLWFGSTETITAFETIVDKIPARLLFTLNMYAEYYFDASADRMVKPLLGVSKRIKTNQMLTLYSAEQLEGMKQEITALCLSAVKARYAAMISQSASMYIDEALFGIPVSIGDRTETVQDISAALAGSTFPVEGNSLRLFMQWGTGLPAQRLDMDLSCQVIYGHTVTTCAYYSLVVNGCKHSGDFTSIPDKKGIAEYIEIDTEVLSKAGAKYVAFTCNAYSNGTITPNLVIGWMNSRYSMKISANTGVAYDPSCVQHQVRVTKTLNKGMLFGVLDVQKKEVIWLEMPFDGQTVASLNLYSIESMLRKLKSKITIGQLLTIKAEAQQMHITDTADADEVYTLDWARNIAAVTQLLPD